MGLVIQVPGDFGPTGFATGAALARQNFVGDATRAFVIDPRVRASMFQDREGTTPVAAIGDPVLRMNDRSGQGRHAILADGATGVPTWQGDYVDIPLDARFEVPNPIRLTSYTSVVAVRLTGASSGSETNILAQSGPSSSSYLACQFGRRNGQIRVNVNNSSGWELAGPSIDLDTDYVFAVQVARDASDPAQYVKVNGGDKTTGTYADPSNFGADQTTTNIFGHPSTTTTSGRLYYCAWVNRLVEDEYVEALEALLAERLAE